MTDSPVLGLDEFITSGDDFVVCFRKKQGYHTMRQEAYLDHWRAPTGCLTVDFKLVRDST